MDKEHVKKCKRIVFRSLFINKETYFKRSQNPLTVRKYSLDSQKLWKGGDKN